jgi:dynein regulatory complex protein 1
MELQTMYEKQKREEEFQFELTKIRGTDAEDYNNLKVTLENNIQLLEQQLEEMRATYQLNTEKLEYNHAVLEERDSENKQTVEHHRQRLRRLKEALSNHKQRFFKQDAKFKNENNELTEDYKRITEQFKDLQKKFRHFEMVDNKKYREVWAMNEDNVMQVVKKVLQANSIIHEQILGLPHHTSYSGPDGQPLQIDQITSAHIFNAIHPREEEASLTAQMGLNATNDNATTNSMQPMGRFSREQIRAVMAMLASEAQFLVDSRLKDTLRGMTDEESDIYRVDAVLSSLGVEDREDLDELVGFFYADDPKAEKPSVHPNDIIKVVKEFVVQRQQSKTKTAEGIGIKTDTVSNEKKARKRERERAFWQKLGNVVSPHTQSVWDALEKAQRRYNTLLEERAAAIDDTTELAKQNEELKILLQEYLGSNINQDLQIPPTRLITVNNDM